MWWSYLLVGIRTMSRNWVHAAINVTGLAVGLASCILILLFVQQQQTFEKWMPGVERVAQLQTVLNDPDEGRILSAQASRPAAEALAEEFPQVEASVAMTQSRVLLGEGENRRFNDVYFVDPAFFRVFALPLVRGDPATALRSVGNVVVTESEARRLFGNADVLGRELTINSRGVETALRVTGVLRDLPANTHLKFTILTPFDHAVLGTNEYEFRSWSRMSGYVYVRLRTPEGLQAVNAGLPALLARRLSAEARHNPPYPAGLSLVPVGDIHLGGAREDSMRPAGDRLAVSAFAAIALLILLIACMNFANLATAQSARRAREVALRKVMGAGRGQLVRQFFSEALLVTLVAMLIALALVEVAAPAFGAVMRADIRVAYLGPDGILLPVILLWLAVGFVCGTYPAMVLSRFAPARILRSGRPELDGAGPVRNLLVVGQFAISIALIICTAIVYAQTSYARSADPGFPQSGLIAVDNLMRLHNANLHRSFTVPLRGAEGVTAVGLATAAPGDDRQGAVATILPGRADPVLLNLHFVDWGYREALGMPLLAGRFFDEARPLDDATIDFDPTNEDGPALVARGATVVLSESAARRIGASGPAQAIGRRLLVPVRGVNTPLPATVIGVVGDAQLRSVRDRIRPAVYLVNTGRYTHALIRFENADPTAVLAAAAAAWDRVLPTVPFEGRFVEDIIAEFYDTDAARGRVFAVFAGLAVFISCLGLFGLAVFTTQRRTKEIGIRKVFGATATDIVRLLVWQFSRLVLIANLIAWPVAWWLMRDWLSQFSARISLHPGWFVAAGASALLIAALTVGVHAVRVARTSPVHALRYE